MNLREAFRQMLSPASARPSETSVIPEEQEPSRVYQLVATRFDALQQERDRAAALEEQEKARQLEPLREGVGRELDRITQEVSLQITPTLDTIQSLGIIEALKDIARIPQLAYRETGRSPTPWLFFVIQLSKEGEEEPLFIPGPSGPSYGTSSLSLGQGMRSIEELSLLTDNLKLRDYIRRGLSLNFFHWKAPWNIFSPYKPEPITALPQDTSSLGFDDVKDIYDFLVSLKVEKAIPLSLSLHWNEQYSGSLRSESRQLEARNFIRFDFKQVNGGLYLHLYGAPKYSDENWVAVDSLNRERWEELIAAEVVRQIEIGAQPIVKIGPPGKSGRSKIFNKDLQISGEMVPFFPQDWGHFYNYRRNNKGKLNS